MPKMKRYFTFLASLVFVCALACACHGEPIKLAYKFTKGELDKYRTNLSMNMTMPAIPGMGNVPPIAIEMETVVQQRTLEVLPDGSAKVRTTYSVPRLKITGGPKGKMPEISKQSFSISWTITPQGRVTSVEGAEKLQKMFESAGIQNFDMSLLTHQMTQFVFLPEEPVDVGSTWSQVVPLPLGWGDLRIESTLDSYGEQLWSQTTARITQKFNGRIDLSQVVKSVTSSAPLSEKERRSISEVSGSMEVDGNTTFLFAPVLGKILKASGQMWGKITINMPSEVVRKGGPAQMTMSMDMKFSLTRFK